MSQGKSMSRQLGKLALLAAGTLFLTDNGGAQTKPAATAKPAATDHLHRRSQRHQHCVQKPYWLTDSSPDAKKAHTGTSHGTPYFYDQRVPVLLMGFGIQPGEYFGPITPADIAPTLAALTGVTLATRDGRVLAEALKKNEAKKQ